MTDPNRSFQHYEVLRRDDGTPWELGRGAMGITYKAFDVNLCCEVALKVVNSALLDHPDARERFVREARAAAALRHRNVASVYHLGNDGEHFFYAMEFIDGETLDALVRRHGPLPPDVVLRMIGQVSRALAAAERQQLVHRDIKPTNLMIVHEDADEEMTIKVIDFGLARPAMGAESAAQVTVGGFVGTPQYASPEQLEERGLDARSDIYSLGVTAWYLLTGQPPFTGSLATVCQQQLGQPPPWKLLPGGIPACVHDLLGHMLEKNPARRPQNARALREEIEECARRVPQRPWHLPPLGTGGGTARHPSGQKVVSSRSETRPSNTLANGRYTLLQLLEEGHGTRVYQARERQAGGSLVTLRTLPFQLTRDAAALTALGDEIRLIQAANHPNLVQIRALEPAAQTTPAFLVEEPLAGFSLRDLLAGHGGTLPVGDTLRLLEQMAAAADHAESRRLEQLDFALHHLRVHFPFSDPSAGDFDSRTFLTLPMERWPDWRLKVHPFFVERDALEHHTWAGDVTLVPGAATATDAPDTQAEALSTRYVRRVAILAYELLGGAPMAGAGSASLARNVSLSALNETGNAVLSRALADPAAFPACHDFLQQLAAGEHPRRQLPTESAPVPLLPFTGGKSMSVTMPVRLPTTYSGTPHPASRIGTALPIASSPRGSTATAPEPESAAGFFESPAVLAANLADALPEGSAWERMSTNGGGPVRPGRWLLGAALIVGMFAAAFAGVLAWLLHAEPTKRPHARPESVASKPASSPHARSIGTPTPIKAAIPQETPEPAIREPSSAAGPLINVQDVRESTPPVSTVSLSDAETANTPPALPVPGKEITLQLNSVPQGAEVRLHGRLLGVTPFETQLPPGDYELITSYRNWPPSGKTVHLNAGQTRATSVIELLPPGLDPLNAIPSPRNVRTQNPVSPSDRRPARSTPVRVEHAIPVSPAPPTNELPVRRPLPLEPFENGARPADSQRVDQPAPTASDDDEN